MAATIFYQGEDVILELAILNGSTPVDLSTATDFRVELYNVSNSVNTKLYTYSKVSLTGYGVAKQKTGTGNENIIQVIVKRDQSATFALGMVNAEAVVSFTNAAYPSDGSKRDVYQFSNIAVVYASLTKSENIG